MNKTQLTLLTSRRFFPLFVTQFLGAFNDNIFKNALLFLITYKLANLTSHGAQILENLAGAIFILPFFLFSAMAGQIADKFEKSRLISIIKFIEIILMIVATIGFYHESVTLLMCVLFAMGLHSTFFGPLKYSILPDQLDDTELIAGNGLVDAGTFISIILGTIAGGFIVYNHGEFIISMLICIVSIGGWISSLYIQKSHNYNPKLTVNFNFIKDSFDLIKYSQERWDIFLAILGISWFWLVGSIFLLEVPIFAKEILHANEHIATLLIALFCVGLAIGSLLCNRLLKGKIHATYVPLGALAMTIAILDMYFAASSIDIAATTELMGIGQFLLSFNNWHIMLDLVIMAIGGGIYTVPLYALLMNRSDKHHRARVIASNNIMNALFMVCGAIGTTIMLKLGFSVVSVFLVMAIANGIVSIYVCKLLPDVLIRSFLTWTLTSLYRVKIKGIENYHAAGGRVVIIANHTSFIDAILLATFLPDKLTFAITARKWWVNFFMSLVETYQLDPTNPMAIKSLINFVQQDKRCVIFPEGRLTMTGTLMKIYEGPGLVADKANAKLLPIRIQGAQFTPFSRLRGKVKIRLMPKITVTIFPPQEMDLPSTLKGHERRQKIGFRLYDVMTEMMFESSDYHQTLFSTLLEASSMHGGGLEIIEDIDRAPVSYKQFITRCFVLGGIIAKTTHPGEHVGILLPNMITNAVTLFAMQAYSRVPAMLNYSTGIQNVVNACHTGKIKTVYTSHKFIQLGKLTEMESELLKNGIKLVYLEDLRNSVSTLDKLKGKFMSLWPTKAYEYINKKQDGTSHIDPDAAAVILFTSGSEGTPKGVVLSHTNIQANRCQISALVDFTANDKVLNALPIFHSFGLTGGLFLPILSGVKVFLYPSPLHYRIVPELAYDTNATVLFGTDTFLAGYAKYAHPYDFYSVRYIFAGAEKLRPETRLVWSQKFGVRVFEGYGATEAAPVVAINTPMQNKIGTVGRLLPGIKHQIKPVPGIDLGGVLMISGPNIMKGYLLSKDPGVLVPPENGWYDTGDVVTEDEIGFITIVGRVKRFAKIAGEMVSLTMVEQQIYKLWPDHQHAVVSIPDLRKGEQLVLITTHPSATRDQIVTHARAEKMGEISIPKNIMIVEVMPLLGTGKIDYVAVKNLIDPAMSQEEESEESEDI